MDLVCFSHLPWNFVYQRPQHLLSRFALDYRVFYFQEFEYNDSHDGYAINKSEENVWIVIPHLHRHNGDDLLQRQRNIVSDFFKAEKISTFIGWYYTPMSLLFSAHLQPTVTVYDCMDELSAFKFADPQLKEAEKLLFQKADIVFTGGNSLYEAKKHQHPNVYAFPSSIDKDHFGRARLQGKDPLDQLNIPHPRLGFFGVIDERFDISMIEQAANMKPDWHFILIGPVVKIDPEILPRNNNIHYLGSKSYNELPDYLRGWDIALIPFAINDSTKFISPTKTPEYLAAGKAVISTPITDVIVPYGEIGMVHIVDNAEQLVEKASLELDATEKESWLSGVDDFLSNISWDITWQRMLELIKKEVSHKQNLRTIKKEIYV
ncbi:MAG: UDP-galactopyranose mutase [Ferruginibacter sp.]|nr:UDP-galactopyranose mutase [Ferruginibacter sp.]